MMRRIRAAFGVANDWVQDPVGLLVAFMALLLAGIVYMGLMRLAG